MRYAVYKLVTTPMKTDSLSEYFKVRNDYVHNLKEADMLNRRGGISSEIFDSGTFQPAPGQEDEWLEHCRKYPNDPICLLGTPGENRIEEFLDIRGQYLAEINERDLTHIQRAVSDFVVAASGGVRTGGNVGLVSPDDPNADDIINDPIVGPVARRMSFVLTW